MDWIIANWVVIGMGLGAADIILGGLPDKITRYPGAILKICHNLYEYGKVSKLK